MGTHLNAVVHPIVYWCLHSTMTMTMTTTVMLLLSWLLPVLSLESQSTSEIATKDPKLFYISSSTTTSVLSTSSLCYKTSGTLAACTKKRKRQILDDIQTNYGVDISPSRNQRDEMELESSEDKITHRDPKFLLYWATMTTTTTSTTSTATLTLFSLGCTPSGFGVAICA